MIALLAALVLQGAADAEKAALAWAKEVEAEFALYDPCPSIDRRFDVDVLLERALRDTGTLATQVPGYREDFTKAFKLDAAICRSAKERGGYRLLKVWTDGCPRALFRLLSESGFNYHEWLLDASGGELKIHDVFIYQHGEYLSETYRRALLRDLARRAEFPHPLTTADQEILRKVRRTSALLDAGARGDAEELFRLYAELPPELQKDRGVLLARVKAGLAAGGRAGLEALRDLRTHYPDEAFTAFQAFIGYVGLRQTDSAAEALRKLETFTGRDAYLRLQAGELESQREAFERALERFREASRMEPTLADVHWAIIGTANRLKAYDLIPASMTALEEDHDVRFPNLADNRTFAAFAASEAYAAWLKSRGPRGEKTYDLRLPQKPRAGTALEFTNTRRWDLRTTTLKGKTPVNQQILFDGHSFRGLIEIREVEGRKPTHLRVSFRKAARRVEGRTEGFPFEGRTVVVRGFDPADRKVTYENGEELKGEDRAGVLLALSQDEDKGDPDSAEAFYPKEPVRVGESWEPDLEKLMRDFAGGPFQTDPKSGRASFKLRAVEMREGLEFASLRGQFVLPLSGLGDLRLENPIPLTMNFQADACVAGELPDTRVRASFAMEGESPMRPPGATEPLTLRLALKGGGWMIQRLVE